MSFRKRLLGALLVMMSLFGCTSYYAVRDPATRNEYYTTDVASAGSSGAVRFKDAKTGGTVTLQSSEVKEISKDEFAKGTAAPAAATAPAAAPVVPAAATPAPAQ